MVEVVRLLHLPASEGQAFADLACALGRSLPKPALELGEAGGSHEDRDRARPNCRDSSRSLGLELEDAAAPSAEDPFDLIVQRPVALTGHIDHVFEEVARSNAPVELALAEKVVLAPILLALPLRSGRRRDRDLQVVAAREQLSDERAFAGARRSRNDEELPCPRRRDQPLNSSTSS